MGGGGYGGEILISETNRLSMPPDNWLLGSIHNQIRHNLYGKLIISRVCFYRGSSVINILSELGTCHKTAATTLPPSH